MNNMNLLVHCCFTESGIGVPAMKGFQASPLGLERTQFTFSGGERNEDFSEFSRTMFLLHGRDFYKGQKGDILLTSKEDNCHAYIGLHNISSPLHHGTT